jgi:hypothetical protein
MTSSLINPPMASENTPSPQSIRLGVPPVASDAGVLVNKIRQVLRNTHRLLPPEERPARLR